MPALNAAMLSSRSGSGVSPVTTRQEMPRAQRVADMMRVRTPQQKTSHDRRSTPRATISSQAAADGGVVVGGALEFAGDEFAAAAADAADVDLGPGRLRRQRRQPAVADSRPMP